MKNYLLLLITILSGSTTMAEPISKSKAASIAAKYMLSVNKKAKVLTLVDDNRVVRKAKGLTDTDQPYYAFNSEDNAGFVIIAGDDLMPEIVGYSNKGAISADNMADGLQFYLECYSEYVRQVRNGSITPRKAPLGDNTVIVGPLLKTEWNQTYPYNKYAPSCPNIFGDAYNGTFPIGCVAVAVGQVMNYWQWPKAIDAKGDLFVATKTLYDEQNKEVGCVNDTLDLTNSTQPDYDWSNMTDRYLRYDNADNIENYESKAEAVGTFLRDVAYSLSMNWYSDGGGTWAQSGVLTKYFGYSKDCHHVFADMLEGGNKSDAWMNLIKDDMENGRPIIYGGSSVSGGHAFVFDGLDSANRVHVNWGWGGSENGWFDVTCLNTNMYDANDKGDYDFSFDCDGIFNLHPNRDGMDETVTPLPTDVRIFDFLLYSHGRNGSDSEYDDVNSIRKIINPERPNSMYMYFFNGSRLSGIDFDYQYLFTSEDGTEKAIGVRNVMNDKNTTVVETNSIFENSTSLNDVFSLKNGTYQIAYRNNIHNEKGDETGYNNITLPFTLIKQDDQCVLINNVKNYNSIYHDTKTAGDVKYWKNVFTFNDLDNLVEGDSTIIVFDADFPTPSLEPFDMDADTDCSIVIKNRTTGETVWEDTSSRATFHFFLMQKDDDQECGYTSMSCPTKPFATGDYTLEFNYPLFRMVFTKDFTVKSATTGIEKNSTTTSAGSKMTYNLAGQRVGSDYHGIVINNGIKEIRKQ